MTEREKNIAAGGIFVARSLSQRVLKIESGKQEKFFGEPSKKQQKSKRKRGKQKRQIDYISHPQIVKWGNKEVDLRSISERLMIRRDPSNGRIVGYR